jgi:hypothetical protein
MNQSVEERQSLLKKALTGNAVFSLRRGDSVRQPLAGKVSGSS